MQDKSWPICLEYPYTVFLSFHSFPPPVKGHIRKGHALLALKDTVKAMQAFQEALEVDSNNEVCVYDYTSSVECGCMYVSSEPYCVEVHDRRVLLKEGIDGDSLPGGVLFEVV